MVENNIMVTIQPKIINTDVVSRLIHDITPILQTLNPANSQIIPAIKDSDLVFISLCYEALIYVCKGTNKVLSYAFLSIIRLLLIPNRFSIEKLVLYLFIAFI